MDDNGVKGQKYTIEQQSKICELEQQVTRLQHELTITRANLNQEKTDLLKTLQTTNLERDRTESELKLQIERA